MGLGKPLSNICSNPPHCCLPPLQTSQPVAFDSRLSARARVARRLGRGLLRVAKPAWARHSPRRQAARWLLLDDLCRLPQRFQQTEYLPHFRGESSASRVSCGCKALSHHLSHSISPVVYSPFTLPVTHTHASFHLVPHSIIRNTWNTHISHMPDTHTAHIPDSRTSHMLNTEITHA